MATRKQEEPSFYEHMDYENQVESIRKLAISIARTTKEYLNESGLMCDGWKYTDLVKGDVAKIQACMRKINAYSKKYGNL